MCSTLSHSADSGLSGAPADRVPPRSQILGSSEAGFAGVATGSLRGSWLPSQQPVLTSYTPSCLPLSSCLPSVHGSSAPNRLYRSLVQVWGYEDTADTQALSSTFLCILWTKQANFIQRQVPRIQVLLTNWFICDQNDFKCINFSIKKDNIAVFNLTVSKYLAYFNLNP